MLISLTKYWSVPLWGSTSWTIDYFTVMSLVPVPVRALAFVVNVRLRLALF